jgi:hypothetical protein
MGGQHYRTATAGCSKAAVLRHWAYPLPAAANQRDPSDTREQSGGGRGLVSWEGRTGVAETWRKADNSPL